MIEDIKVALAPMRSRRAELAKDKNLVSKILADGAEKARVKAQAKMKGVREKIGVN